MQRVQHLFERASSLTAQRGVSLTRIGSGSTAENKHCHRLASLKLRSGIAADPALSWQLEMHRQKQRLTTIKKEQTALRRKLAALEKEALTIEAQWRNVNSPAVAVAGAGGDDTAMPAEFVQRLRQAAALDVLNALGVLWSEDELTIRRLFKLPVSRNLLDSSREKALGSTDIPDTLEPESE